MRKNISNVKQWLKCKLAKKHGHLEGHLRFFFLFFLETLCRKFFHATDNMEKVHKNLKYVQIYILQIWSRWYVSRVYKENSCYMEVFEYFVGIKTATIIKIVGNSGSDNEIYYRKPG